MITSTRKKLFVIWFTAFLILGIYFINSLLWMDKNLELKSSPVLNSLTSVEKALILGGTITLEAQDINALIEQYLSDKKNTGYFKIESVTSSIINNKIYFYAKAGYNNLRFQLSTCGTLDYDNSTINYYPEYFKLGKISLPKKIILNMLSSYTSVNTDKARIEIPNRSLPIEIENLQLKDSKLEIKIKAPSLNLPKLIPESKPNNQTGLQPNSKSNSLNSKSVTDQKSITNQKSNTTEKSSVNPTLLRASSQLGKVYSSVKTANEKQIIFLLQSVVDKMAESQEYSYKKDADAVISKYNTLTSAEKNHIKNAILNNMDFQTLLQLKNTFGL